MDDELAEQSWFDIALPVGILLVLVALGWAGLRHMQKPGTSRSAAEIVQAIEHPAPVVAQSVDVVTVYQCERNGQKVMSERPCGPVAVTRSRDGSRGSADVSAPVK